MKRLLGAMVMGALVLLTGCGGNRAQMLQQLEALEEQNHSGEPMLNDSLAESLVEYFDDCGDANERMRSRYILGRTYYCLGELPRALETYNEAINCADTTSSDCDFAKLSRVYAQSAAIYYDQVQARSQLESLRQAEYCAWRGKDTLMAVECYAKQADGYGILQQYDSVIFIKENAAGMFKNIGRDDRAAQTIGSTITSLIETGNLSKAKLYCRIYEQKSGFFDNNDISKGHEIYYYIKGKYYLAIHQLDSAEYMFRKELRDAKDLNNQIAGSKGLQELYELSRNSDSIAKYAKLSYELNDSAYLLSEMQNIQKFQASYNYNHQKRLAEESKKDAEQSRLIFILFAIILLFVGGVSFAYYRSKKLRKIAEYRQNLNSLGKIQSELQRLCGEDTDIPSVVAGMKENIIQLQSQISGYKKNQADKDIANLEKRIREAKIIQHLKELLEENPVQQASRDDIRQIANLINEQIPVFYNSLNNPVVLRPVEYEVCMLVRCHFSPSAVGKLLNLDESYVSNLRKRILHKVYGIEGNPKDLDRRLMAIV